MADVVEQVDIGEVVRELSQLVRDLPLTDEDRGVLYRTIGLLQEHE